MKLAIMQPYVFPYIGYFQLAAAVDRFVFYDDVNYIKNGWINRNRMLIGDQVHYLTVPLVRASSSLKICDVQIQPREQWLRKLLESIRHAYAKAPHYTSVSELIGSIFATPTGRISVLASHSVTEICRYLDMDTTFVPTSSDYANTHLKGEERVLDICRQEGARTYVNLPGGRDLYSPARFATAGLEISFIEPELRPYPQSAQSGSNFHPALSILDVLMYNSRDEVKDMLGVRVTT
ncbi:MULTISPECIES: WbqC family protein [Paraburkholderia]|uniref:WbqC family protein n=1 Tax=Paraburkholderia strydomiana TaxID=1245417 RepID=A0ABW9BX48_9BURK